MIPCYLYFTVLETISNLIEKSAKCLIDFGRWNDSAEPRGVVWASLNRTREACGPPPPPLRQSQARPLDPLSLGVRQPT